jgi:hypothetical protein
MLKKYVLHALLITLLASPFSLVSASASQVQTIGDLSGKWTLPKTIKMPKGKCGTFNASFKLGPRSLKEGTSSTSYGYSALFLHTKSFDPIAAAVVSWNDFKIEETGKPSQSFKVQFCKSDWQNEDGDFVAAITLGKVGVTIVLEGGGLESEFKSSVTVTK